MHTSGKGYGCSCFSARTMRITIYTSIFRVNHGSGIYIKRVSADMPMATTSDMGYHARTAEVKKTSTLRILPHFQSLRQITHVPTDMPMKPRWEYSRAYSTVVPVDVHSFIKTQQQRP